jgi:hypothetical protein
MKFPKLKTAKVLTKKQKKEIIGGFEDLDGNCNGGCRKQCKTQKKGDISY